MRPHTLREMLHEFSIELSLGCEITVFFCASRKTANKILRLRRRLRYVHTSQLWHNVWIGLRTEEHLTLLLGGARSQLFRRRVPACTTASQFHEPWAARTFWMYFPSLTVICFNGVDECDNFVLQLTLYLDLDNLVNVSVVGESRLQLLWSDLPHR